MNPKINKEILNVNSELNGRARFKSLILIFLSASSGPLLFAELTRVYEAAPEGNNGAVVPILVLQFPVLAYILGLAALRNCYSTPSPQPRCGRFSRSRKSPWTQTFRLFRLRLSLRLLAASSPTYSVLYLDDNVPFCPR